MPLPAVSAHAASPPVTPPSLAPPAPTAHALSPEPMPIATAPRSALDPETAARRDASDTAADFLRPPASRLAWTVALRSRVARAAALGLIAVVIAILTYQRLTVPPLADSTVVDNAGPISPVPAGTSSLTFRADAWQLPNEPLLGFVEIPSGPFQMGSAEGADAEADELPPHVIDLPGYFVGRYEVTGGQFNAYVQDADVKIGDDSCLSPSDPGPVCKVSWDEAIAYANWLDRKLKAWRRLPDALATKLRDTSRPWRVTLPSEAEWEKAARGTEGLVYPWGNEWDSHEGDNRSSRGRLGWIPRSGQESLRHL